MDCGEASKVDVWNLKLWSFPVLCCLFRCWNRIQTYIFDLHLGIYRILRILRMGQVLNSGRNAWLRRNTKKKHKLQILESNWNTERAPVLRCPEPKSESPKGASNPQVTADQIDQMRWTRNRGILSPWSIYFILGSFQVSSNLCSGQVWSMF